MTETTGKDIAALALGSQDVGQAQEELGREVAGTGISSDEGPIGPAGNKIEDRNVPSTYNRLVE